MKLVLSILGLKSTLCATELSEVGHLWLICSNTVNIEIKGFILQLAASAFWTTSSLVPSSHFAFYCNALSCCFYVHMRWTDVFDQFA